MKKPITILIMACVAGCGAPDQRAKTEFQVVYRAVFQEGSIGCCFVDRIHDAPQPLAKGQGNVAGAIEDVLVASDSDRIGLVVKAPMPIPKGETPSVGLFSTGLDYGPGAVFSVRATFRRPKGPHLPPTPEYSNAWAVGVAARTGDLEDSALQTRLTATFRVRNDIAVLNVQGINETLSLDDIQIDPTMYEKIFSDVSPQFFSIELFVNRSAGAGKAILTAGTYSKTVPFTMKDFLKDSGPTVQVVGATLANCCAPGETAKVEVTDFQISAQVPSF